MTFSISGRCEMTGMLGVAITTSSICVAARCPWARAGVGAVATQNITDPALGPEILDLLENGEDARSALEAVVTDRSNIDYRQIAVVDAAGGTAHYTGSKTLGVHAIAVEENAIAAGNLLADPFVPRAMVDSFGGDPSRHLAERLLAALEAGIAAGGEEGPVHSGGLYVVHDQIWPLVDLRIDWSEGDPVGALRDLWTAYEPQMMDYVTRAKDPASAPAYGVPGDL